MNSRRRFHAVALCGLLLACGCSSSGSGSTPPTAASFAQVRFAEGAPDLEAIIDGALQSIGPAYLQVDGQTVSTVFNYGSFTPFGPFNPGTHSLSALDVSGYRVGPFKTPALSAGKSYTLVLVGSYPNYQVLSFEEPPISTGAVESLYEASPAVPQADFGRFEASSHSHFVKLGSGKLGSVTTVSLGSSVSNFGGYAGSGIKPFEGGTVTPAAINSFDTHNVLPFHKAARLSLFLFDVDPASSSLGPVFGSLDR